MKFANVSLVTLLGLTAGLFALTNGACSVSGDGLETNVEDDSPAGGDGMNAGAANGQGEDGTGGIIGNASGGTPGMAGTGGTGGAGGTPAGTGGKGGSPPAAGGAPGKGGMTGTAGKGGLTRNRRGGWHGRHECRRCDDDRWGVRHRRGQHRRHTRHGRRDGHRRHTRHGRNHGHNRNARNARRHQVWHRRVR